MKKNPKPLKASRLDRFTQWAKQAPRNVAKWIRALPYRLRMSVYTVMAFPNRTWRAGLVADKNFLNPGLGRGKVTK